MSEEALTAEIVLEKIKEKYAGNLGKNCEISSVFFSTQNFLGNRIGLPVTIEYDQTTTTGKNKGAVRRKKKEIYFFPQYCPFTGEKIKEQS